MTHDPRNARHDDPWTSHEGTTGISQTQRAEILAYYRTRDRPDGYTTGEIEDAGWPDSWRRVFDLHRDGYLRLVTDASGTVVTRVWPGSGKPQRAFRANYALALVPAAAAPWPPPGECDCGCL